MMVPRPGTRCPICCEPELAEAWARVVAAVRAKRKRASWRLTARWLREQASRSTLSENTVVRHAREHTPDWPESVPL